MSKTLMYLRTSTSDDEPGLEDQRRACVAYALDHGLEVVDVVEAVGLGSSEARATRARVVDRVLAGEVDTVLVSSLDRWSRSFTEVIKLGAKGKVLSVADEDSAHRFSRDVMMQIATFQQEELSRAAKERAARRRK